MCEPPFFSFFFLFLLSHASKPSATAQPLNWSPTSINASAILFLSCVNCVMLFLSTPPFSYTSPRT
jgi:hypothetical protein